MASVERSYGSAAAISMKVEKAIMGNFQRLPGLRSSHVGLNTVLGVDEDIDFEDILNGTLM